MAPSPGHTLLNLSLSVMFDPLGFFFSNLELLILIILNPIQRKQLKIKEEKRKVFCVPWPSGCTIEV